VGIFQQLHVNAQASAKPGAAPGPAPEGWTTGAPREEIRPTFEYTPTGGGDGEGCFIIRAGDRDGLAGYWTRTFPITGGKWYRVFARYKARGVEVPRRSIVMKLDWQDERGRSVRLDEPTVAGYLKGSTGLAETEHPVTRGVDAQGWTQLLDTYHAPSLAKQATLGSPSSSRDWRSWSPP